MLTINDLSFLVSSTLPTALYATPTREHQVAYIRIIRLQLTRFFVSPSVYDFLKGVPKRSTNTRFLNVVFPGRLDQSGKLELMKLCLRKVRGPPNVDESDRLINTTADRIFGNLAE